MRKLLVTIYFDVDDEKIDEKRDFDRFILESDNIGFKRKLFEIFDRKKYSWDDYQKIKRGYKPIMSIEQLDLTDLQVFSTKELTLEATKIEALEQGLGI